MNTSVSSGKGGSGVLGLQRIYSTYLASTGKFSDLGMLRELILIYIVFVL